MDAGAVSAFDFSTIDTTQIMPTIMAAIGFCVSVSLGPILAKKGYRWAMAAIKHA